MGCYYCMSTSSADWAEERGISVVRCRECGLLYVSPRPDAKAVDDAVHTGMHPHLGLNARSRRIPSKVRAYSVLLRQMFPDVLNSAAPIHWVDVGCGYGEVMEAVSLLSPKGSRVTGFEPMRHKAEAARLRGLNVENKYLSPGAVRADVISAIDIFSHIPDFRGFLACVCANLNPKGLFLLETGNLADTSDRSEFPGDLGVPDHLVFAGEKHLRGYLAEFGFNVERIEYRRSDDLLGFAKCVVKWILGRPVVLRLPYTSRYRQLRIRARLV